MAALQGPRGSSVEVLGEGFLAILNLVVGNAANKVQLGELGACQGALLDLALTLSLVQSSTAILSYPLFYSVVGLVVCCNVLSFYSLFR